MDQHSVPLIYYGYHGSTLFTLSIIMDPMDPHYVPLIYDGSHGSLQYAPLIYDGSHSSTLFSAKLGCIPWIPPIPPTLNDDGSFMIKMIPAPYLDHTSARRFFLLHI